MKKIKGQGTLTKLITSKLARRNRQEFAALIRDSDKLRRANQELHGNDTVDIDVVSFSSSRDFEEQILSILSFVRYIGQPVAWTIYSDGSHSNQEIDTVKVAFPFAKIVKISFDQIYFSTLKQNLQPFKEELNNYATNYVLGKKVCTYLNYTIDKPTLFLDSDIVFYQKSPLLDDLIKNKNKGCFLVDPTWNCLHSQYSVDPVSESVPLNAGLIMSNDNSMDITRGLNFLKTIGKNYEYFTDQTILHAIAHSNNYLPLDRKLFIVDTADQFDFSYAFNREQIAVRHYTGPVRHKMWQRNWKWHLSLS